MEKVFIVAGGCTGDEHIIAVYDTLLAAAMRAEKENAACVGLNAYIETHSVMGVRAKMSTREKELEFICDFACNSIFKDDTCCEKLRSLWTSYCIRYSLAIHNGAYENTLLDMWDAISSDENNGEQKSPYWCDFNDFCAYMSEHLR